jgi:hypothetical protein
MFDKRFENINIKNIKINHLELAQRLKVPGDFENDFALFAVEEVERVCKPAFCAVGTEIKLCENNFVDLGFTGVVSKDLYKNLSGCKRGYIMAVTLGMEADRLIMSQRAVSAFKGFVFDAVASAYVEAACDYVSKTLADSITLKPRYSPGYGDLALEVQREVLSFLNADRLLGIKLGENLLMTPKKTITAIQGVIE